MKRILFALTLFGLVPLTLVPPAPAYALDDPAEMLKDPQQEQRAARLGAQLRCLVCQNESIEDSSADLARDLRHVVRDHVAHGETDAQIMQWMTVRYGDFIRLQPRFTRATLLLWAMPVLALLAGTIAAGMMLRRKPSVAPLSEAERFRLDRLLASDPNREIGR